MTLCRSRRTVVAVDIADRRREDVDVGCDEILNVGRSCEERCGVRIASAFHTTFQFRNPIDLVLSRDDRIRTKRSLTYL